MLDRHLAGQSMSAIATEQGISRQRVQQMLVVAKQQLAYRVFKGLRRPMWSRPRGEYWA